MPSELVPSESGTKKIAPHALCIRVFLTELLGRYLHLRAFVDKCSKEARGRSPYLFAAYLSEIGEEVEQLMSSAPVIVAASETDSISRDLFAPFNFLANRSSRFQKNHQALRSFATPWPDSEVFEFLKHLFGENGLTSEFQGLHPTIVNSDEFNFLKYDLRQDLLMPISSSVFAVWALPKSESTNPLLWPVLVHEAAHSLFPDDFMDKDLYSNMAKQKLSEQDYETLKRWAIELNADYFAYRLLGPAYILCLMYFSMFFVVDRLRERVRERVSSDRFLDEESHPPPERRIAFLQSEFERFLVDNSLGENCELKREYDRFAEIYNARVGLDDAKRSGWDHIDMLSQEPLSAAWEVVKTAQCNAVPLMREVCFCKEEFYTAHRLGISLNTYSVAASVRADSSLDSLRDWIERGGLYDLRVMSVAATNDLVSEGRNLVIVALVDTDLHIRIFDASGEKVVDKAENELVSGEALTAFKKRLNPFPEKSSLSHEQKQEIIRNVTSITGHIPEGKKDILRKLNERPARMFEILNAGWMAKITNLLDGVQRLPTPSSGVAGASGEAANIKYSSDVSTIVSNLIKDSRHLSSLLQKSIQISIVLSSLSQTERHRCDNKESPLC